jgi:D-3-phosphoglycerate dehydrogenase/(S)-sulfolactate dehydrogenase
MKVLITELIWPEGLEELEAFGSVEYDPQLWRDSEALREKIRSADAVIVRNQTRVDATLLEHGASLKAIGRLGVGLDNIDLEAARDRAIPVVLARNANAVSVAEYVMAAVLQCSRNLFAADADVRAGNWDRRRFTGSEVYGKTLGLVGMGEIGQRVARRATAFGMRVLGYDPYVAPYDYPIVETGVELVDLDTLLGSSDFVSLHVPLNPSTWHLFSWATFEKMKPGAWLINAARGGVVDEADLARALEGGLLGGAVLDVLEEEPVSKTSPLLRQDRVVFTPHVAGLTEEAQVNTSVLVVKEVIKVLQGQPSLCVSG